MLSLFQQFSSYRSADIDRIKASALHYIRRAMLPNGSWYGSWGICFTYAGMFALESLASVGETYQTSAQVRKACAFLIGKQMDDGGWGEDYRSWRGLKMVMGRQKPNGEWEQEAIEGVFNQSW